MYSQNHEQELSAESAELAVLRYTTSDAVGSLNDLDESQW
jgi:hypothetical protein